MAGVFISYGVAYYIAQDLPEKPRLDCIGDDRKELELLQYIEKLKPLKTNSILFDRNSQPFIRLAIFSKGENPYRVEGKIFEAAIDFPDLQIEVKETPLGRRAVVL